MQEEMKALHKNDTWELIKLPNVKRAIRCKWVFIEKRRPMVLCKTQGQIGG